MNAYDSCNDCTFYDIGYGCKISDASGYGKTDTDSDDERDPEYSGNYSRCKFCITYENMESFIIASIKSGNIELIE